MTIFRCCLETFPTRCRTSNGKPYFLQGKKKAKPSIWREEVLKTYGHITPGCRHVVKKEKNKIARWRFEWWEKVHTIGTCKYLSKLQHTYIHLYLCVCMYVHYSPFIFFYFHLSAFMVKEEGASWSNTIYSKMTLEDVVNVCVKWWWYYRKERIVFQNTISIQAYIFWYVMILWWLVNPTLCCEIHLKHFLPRSPFSQSRHGTFREERSIFVLPYHEGKRRKNRHTY